MLTRRFPVSSRGTWFLVALLGLGAVLIWTAASRAATCDVSWNSTAVSGSWNTASDWSTGSVPTSSQNVCLPSGSYTVTLNGSGVANSVTIDSGVTLAVAISSSNGATLTLSANGSSTNGGTIDLTDTDTSGSGSPEARILLDSGATLTNTGTIVSDAGAAGLGTRVIDGQSVSSGLVNNGTMTIAQDLQIDSGQSGTFTTSGNITIDTSKKLLVDPNGGFIGGNPASDSAGLDIEGGTITDNGTFAQGISEAGSHAGPGALTVNGGTITGAGLIVVSGITASTTGSPVGASFSGAGSGTYTFVGCGCAPSTTLGGTIGPNQTIVLSANSTNGGGNVQINSNMTNNGTIELTDTDTSGTSQNSSHITIGTGATLTNAGKLVSEQAVAGQQVIDGQGPTSTLDNTGEIDVNGRLQLDTGQNGTFTTTGTVRVAASATFQLDPNGGNTTFNLNGGTITNNGTMELGINSGGGAASGTSVNVNGATVNGDPLIAAAATTTFSGAGSGSFQLEGSGSTLAGTIPAADTVALSGTTGPAGSVNVTTSGNVVNDGTLTMTDPDSAASTSAFAGLVIPSSSTFTNNGTMVSDPGPAASGYRSIDGIVNNAGTLKVNMLLQFALHSAPSGIDNSGTVDIAAGQGIFILGGSDTYTQSAGTTTLGGPGATVSVSAVILQGGTLTGSGALCGPGGNQSAPCGSGATSTELTNGGTISPSPSPAAISVNGDYTQASSGTLTAQVTGAGNNDQLTVSGNAALDGTLQVSTAAGFKPSSGQRFQVLTSSGDSGQFATTTGLQSGPYTVTYNPDNVTLTATTPTPAASFNPSSITFGSAADTVAVGSTVSQILNITDSGTAPLQIGTLSRGGPQAPSFSLSSDGCSGQTVQPGDSCSVTVNFTPAAPGGYSAEVSVPDNAPGSPQQVALGGTAGAPGGRATLSTESIDFGPVGVGVTSAAKTVTVTSAGSGPLNISSVGLSGAKAGDYQIVSDTCSGRSLVPGSSCTTAVTITASAPGSSVAQLVYTDNAPDSPQGVALSGTGLTSGLLSGRVLNGTIPDNPPPLAGASVTACVYGTQTSCQSATTGSDGSYSISGLKPGAWTIQVEPPKPYLFAEGSVLDIVPGTNTHDYTLSPPIGLSNGVSINGQTSGVATSFWTSPATVQAPITVPTSGPAGTVGVTVVQFWAQPLSGTGGAPYAVGGVAIYYKFNPGGAPVFIGMDDQPFPIRSGPGPSIGRWATSVTTKASPFVPVAGNTVANYIAQGNFVPPPGGPDYHGAFFYQIHQWSLFVNGSAPAARDVGARARSAQAAPGTLGEAERCLQATGEIPNFCLPNPPPSNCPPPLEFTNQQGSNGGLWDPGNGAMWDSGTSTLTLPGGIMISNYGGSVTQWTNPESPGSTLPFPYTYTSLGLTINADGSMTYDGYTFFPDGSIQSPGGTKYNKHGQQTGGPPQSDNCKPHYNYWDPITGWQDPSGAVMTTKHIPVAGAKVVLVRSDKHSGPFSKVPNGSLFMSPGNRRNPDHTTALGQFGWDVVPGYYRVSAQHSGCTAAGGGASVFSSVLTIPPAVTNIKLKLRCPLLRRAQTHTKLTARKVPVGNVALVAVVRGHHALGTVAFEHAGRTLGVVTLNPHTGRAVFTAPGKSINGFVAVYEGDGYNAPSSGRG